MCRFLDNAPADMAALKALLPQVKLSDDDWAAFGYIEMVTAQTKAALPRLREAAGKCPSCIMAALRQSGVAIFVRDEFDFKKERDELFAVVNSERMESISCHDF